MPAEPIDLLIPVGLGLDAGAAVALTTSLILEPSVLLGIAAQEADGLALDRRQLKVLCSDREAGRAAGVLLVLGFAAQAAGQSSLSPGAVATPWDLVSAAIAGVAAWLATEGWSWWKGGKLYRRLLEQRSDQLVGRRPLEDS